MIGMILIAVAMIPVFLGWAMCLLAVPILVLTPLVGAVVVAANRLVESPEAEAFRFHDDCLVQILASNSVNSLDLQLAESERLRELFLRAGYSALREGASLVAEAIPVNEWTRQLALVRIAEVTRRNRRLIARASSQTGLVAAYY